MQDSTADGLNQVFFCWSDKTQMMGSCELLLAVHTNSVQAWWALKGPSVSEFVVPSTVPNVRVKDFFQYQGVSSGGERWPSASGSVFL